MAVVGFFPEREVFGIALVFGRFDPPPALQFLHVAAAQLAVLLVGRDVKVDIAVHLVGVPLLNQFLCHLDLLGDMSRGPRGDVGALHAEPVHIAKIDVGVLFGDLHRFQLFDLGLFLQLVLALVGVVGQVADVGNVLDIPHVVSQIPEIADNHVEGDIAFGVPQVGIPIYRRPAYVYAYESLFYGGERFLVTGKRVVNM